MIKEDVIQLGAFDRRIREIKHDGNGLFCDGTQFVQKNAKSVGSKELPLLWKRFRQGLRSSRPVNEGIPRKRTIMQWFWHTSLRFKDFSY